MGDVAVILPAAGKSSRFKNQHYSKVFAPLSGRPVWMHAAERFINRPDVAQVILVISKDDREYFQNKFASNAALLGIDVIDGGSERADSVERGLARVRPECKYVCIHDAARPLLAETWIDQVFTKAKATGAAILAIPIQGTIKRVADHQITATVPRDQLYEAQTPQVFRRDLLLSAYAKRGILPATDDAQLVENLGETVAIVTGSPINLKITTPEDLRLAEHAQHALPKPRLNLPSHPFADDDRWR